MVIVGGGANFEKRGEKMLDLANLIKKIGQFFEATDGSLQDGGVKIVFLEEGKIRVEYGDECGWCRAKIIRAEKFDPHLFLIEVEEVCCECGARRTYHNSVDGNPVYLHLMERELSKRKSRKKTDLFQLPLFGSLKIRRWRKRSHRFPLCNNYLKVYNFDNSQAGGEVLEWAICENPHCSFFVVSR